MRKLKDIVEYINNEIEDKDYCVKVIKSSEFRLALKSKYSEFDISYNYNNNKIYFLEHLSNPLYICEGFKNTFEPSTESEFSFIKYTAYMFEKKYHFEFSDILLLKSILNKILGDIDTSTRLQTANGVNLNSCQIEFVLSSNLFKLVGSSVKGENTLMQKLYLRDANSSGIILLDFRDCKDLDNFILKARKLLKTDIIISDVELLLLKDENDNNLGFRFKTVDTCYDISLEKGHELNLYESRCKKFVRLVNRNGLLVSETESAKGVLYKEISDSTELCNSLIKRLLK